ncbi:BMC domain-containing protein [Pelagibaculum spongiae]|uniref:BMC domain-containing protein n=1 Tax=Pelagibaculum spongiae TaxID=2080658 RepID=A0A2V1H6T3_9GAMM|nr:hypothetical protein DC094_05645 [Pelagibaculum spongiae]
MSQAAGLIETLGYPPAIEAADAAVKSAWVTVESIELAKAGLVTVIVRGDVAAVQAAVAAGSEAAARVGTVVSTHVIPRPSEELCGILWTPGSIANQSASSVSSNVLTQETDLQDAEVQRTKAKQVVIVNTPDIETAQVVEKQSEQVKPEPVENSNVISETTVMDAEQEQPVTDETLRLQKTIKLRQLARNFEDFSMSRNEIKFAKKNQLIEAILAHLSNGNSK